MFCNITTYATIEFLYNRNITLKIDNCIYIECKNNHAARTLHHGHLGKLIGICIPISRSGWSVILSVVPMGMPGQLVRVLLWPVHSYRAGNQGWLRVTARGPARNVIALFMLSLV